MIETFHGVGESSRSRLDADGPLGGLRRLGGTRPIRSAIVVGDSRPHSDVYDAASLIVEQITGRCPDLSIDLVDFGATLFDWSDMRVADIVRWVAANDLVVFASPAIMDTYSELLGLFLDWFPREALVGSVAVPLVCGDASGAAAADARLRPALEDLGASCPAPGLFICGPAANAMTAIDAWVEQSADHLADAVNRIRLAA